MDLTTEFYLELKRSSERVLEEAMELERKMEALGLARKTEIIEETAEEKEP